MLQPRSSLKMLPGLIALLCLVPAGLIAQEAAKTEAEKPEAKTEAKPAEDKKAEEKKPEAKTEEKKPEVKTEEKKPEAKPEDKKPEDKKAEEPALELKEMVINLDNPSGLAIHPKTGHVFIASHDGIHRFIPGELPLKCPLEVTGFPTDVYGKGPKYNISALGVAFLDDEHLVVGDGSRPDAEELVRVYKIAEKHSGKPQKETDAVYTTGPIGASEESVKGEGNYYGVAVLDGVVYVTCNGDDTKGWISKFSIKDGKATPLTPYIATKIATNVDAPVPIAVSPDNKTLVVGQMGEVGTPGDSLLTIYDPKTFNPKEPKAEKKWETGLSDIAGLAYSPKTKKWYCTDFAWAKPEDGGLFELNIEGDKVTAKKLAKLDKPTALAFDKEGNLYVAVFGTAIPEKDDENNKNQDADKMTPGKLLMIEAGQLK